MEFDFYITKNPRMTSPIALRTVYILHADSTYNVRKELTDCSDMVALRTIGGAGVIQICGLPEMTVLPGSLLFLRHADIRRYYCRNGRWDFWWFEFSYGDLIDLPTNANMQVEPVENEERDCSACLELLRKNTPGSDNLASATLAILLCKWMIYHEKSSHTHPHYWAVQNAVNHIRANISERIEVKRLAEIAGLCERRFRQVFTEIMGVQPKNYIETLRSDMAEELLRSTPLSIGEIADRLGYSSPFHFCKAFRKVHDMPPSEYRKGKFP